MSNKLSKIFKKVYIRTMEDHTSKLYWFRQFNECKCNTWVSGCHTLCYSEHNLLQYDNGDWKNSQLIMVTLCYILVWLLPLVHIYPVGESDDVFVQNLNV
jgi:hypothetical protein